jgi:hypothetical protein
VGARGAVRVACGPVARAGFPRRNSGDGALSLNVSGDFIVETLETFDVESDRAAAGFGAG